MIKEALEFNYELGLTKDAVVDVHEDAEKSTKLVLVGGGYELKEYVYPPVPRSPVFHSLDSFVDYLESDHARDAKNGIVFVGDGFVMANMAYREHRQDLASMKFKDAAEYRAMERLCQNNGVKKRCGKCSLLIWMVVSIHHFCCPYNRSEPRKKNPPLYLST